MKATVSLRAGELRAADVRALLCDDAALALDPGARAAVDRAAAVVANIAAQDASVYGVNTGFGALAQTRIPREKLADLQRNLVVSHACGVGALLPREVVRLVLALKVNSLARGYSGRHIGEGEPPIERRDMRARWRLTISIHPDGWPLLRVVRHRTSSTGGGTNAAVRARVVDRADVVVPSLFHAQSARLDSVVGSECSPWRK